MVLIMGKVGLEMILPFSFIEVMITDINIVQVGII
jgi:hypothetical protein